jgi:tetratricopeptide (TPR) repeat protein
MLKTLETGNVYLAENDYFIMPILYSQIIEKKRLDVILAVVDFLYYNWGISNFRNKYGNIPMKEYDLNYNISNIIDAYKNKTNIFLSSYSDHMDKMQLSNNFQQFGLLKKYGVLRLHDISIVFDFYCCNRTLFDKYLHYNKGDLSLIAWYAQGIMVQGNEAMQNNNPNEAIKLYKKTLCYPSEIIVQEDIYYHLARTYELNNDMENELFYLDKVIKSKSDFWPAYEQEGIIYLRKKQFSMTINMFELAIEYGSPHRESLEQQINLVKTKL